MADHARRRDAGQAADQDGPGRPAGGRPPASRSLLDQRSRRPTQRTVGIRVTPVVAVAVGVLPARQVVAGRTQSQVQGVGVIRVERALPTGAQHQPARTPGPRPSSTRRGSRPEPGPARRPSRPTPGNGASPRARRTRTGARRPSLPPKPGRITPNVGSTWRPAATGPTATSGTALTRSSAAMAIAFPPLFAPDRAGNPTTLL